MIHALGDLGTHDSIALLDVPQEVRPLGNVAEAGVAAVKDVLAGGGQVTVKEEPEKLGGTGVGVVLLPRPAQGTVGRKGKDRRLSPRPLSSMFSS